MMWPLHGTLFWWIALAFMLAELVINQRQKANYDAADAAASNGDEEAEERHDDAGERWHGAGVFARACFWVFTALHLAAQ